MPMNARAVALSALVLAIVFLPAVPPAAEAATVAYTLHGDTSGWGFTAPGITSPGPTLTAAVGDTVDLTLFAADGIGHTWGLDYDGDGGLSVPEPESGVFTSPSVGFPFSFVPNQAGTFDYWCGVHFGAMRGPFVILPAPANTPPTVAVSAPTGVERWTGGSIHDVAWTMNDGQTPVTGLTYWVNYTSSAGSGAIAGPLPGTANPHNASWTVPMVDVSDMRVNVTVLDGNGTIDWDEALVPFVDSTAPAVTAVDPVNAATDVATNPTINLTFNETMDQPATEGAVTLWRLPGWTAVPLTVSGWTGNNLSVTPTTPLLGMTTYAVNVSAAALDASDPGNPLAAPFSSNFTTTSATPVAAVTSPVGGESWSGNSTHAIDWAASDAEDPPTALNVSLFYSLTGVAPWSFIGNVTGPSGSEPWTVPGADSFTVRLRITASDTSAKTGEAVSGLFAIDATAPAVQGRTPAPDAADVPIGTAVTVTFSEAMNTSTAWFGLEAVGGAWVAGNASWGAGNTSLTFAPVVPLIPATAYRVHVNATAIDRSDPGNVAAAETWVFTAAAVVDTTAPAIAHTPPGTPAGTVAVLTAVSLSADITDAGGLTAANLTITDVLGRTQRVDFTPTAGPAFTHVLMAQAPAGTVTYTYRAVDTSGNSAERTFNLTVTGTAPYPSLYADLSGWGLGPTNFSNPDIQVTAGQDVTVTLVGVDDVPHYFYVDLNGNAAHDAGEPRSETFRGNVTSVSFRASAAGEYTYYCGFHPGPMSGTLRVAAEVPPGGLQVPLIALLLLLVAIVIVALLVLAVRRRKKPDEATPEEIPHETKGP